MNEPILCVLLNIPGIYLTEYVSLGLDTLNIYGDSHG